MKILRAVDYFGTGVFAMAGTVVGAQAGMNAIGCGVVACITAMGGGMPPPPSPPTMTRGSLCNARGFDTKLKTRHGRGQGPFRICCAARLPCSG
eukprot:SAG25_NODE_2042_length_2004_cov_1.518110_2_plen_94_part_00